MPRAWTALLSASTNRLRAVMPLTVSPFATFQTAVAPGASAAEQSAPGKKRGGEAAMSGARSIPLSADELREAVRANRKVDASRLDRILRPEDGRGAIEVQAGVTWQSIANLLRPGDGEAEAASLRATMRTIGESIARNTAGPDGLPVVTH